MWTFLETGKIDLEIDGERNYAPWIRNEYGP